MIKRLLNCTASDIAAMDKLSLLEAIARSEGRVMACETIGAVAPYLETVTNAEFAAGMGADILVLNMFDVNNPDIQALPNVDKQDTIRELKRLTGKIIAVNLEPAEYSSSILQNEGWPLTDGRIATAQNARTLSTMGADMIILTGNPGNGIKNEAIFQSLKSISQESGSKIILAAGKMHAAGVLTESGESITTTRDIDAFISAGADIILLPAPGTVPGLTLDYVHSLIKHIHKSRALAMTTIGTSQEGADRDTIRRIALLCKMAGTDIHHIGDSGYAGMALPENIMAYSITRRGVRHTYRNMTQSINR